MHASVSAHGAPERSAGTPDEAAALMALAESVRECRLCRLCHDRRHAVPGRGASDARVMFVAEAPGYHEDRAGTPLVGRAGELFDELLGGIGLTRSDVWLTSVLKCRTPRSRSPFPDEIEQCEGFLFQEIARVQPQVICALGNTATRVLTGRAVRIGRQHGHPVEATIGGRSLIVLPLYHPAAVVHVPPLIPVLREDLRQLPRLMRDGMPHRSTSGVRVEAALEQEAATVTQRSDASVADQLALQIEE